MEHEDAVLLGYELPWQNREQLYVNGDTLSNDILGMNIDTWYLNYDNTILVQYLCEDQPFLLQMDTLYETFEREIIPAISVWNFRTRISEFYGNYSGGFDKVSIKQKIQHGIESQAARATARVAPTGLHGLMCTVQCFICI